MTLKNSDNQTVPKFSHMYECEIDPEANEHAHVLKRAESLNANMSAKGCCLHPVKYVSLTEKIQKRMANNDRWYSLEFFPPRTPSGAANLIGW